MKCVLLVVYLHLVPNLSLPFDLPKPLDRFYDEVVRFYKRVKHEGVKTCGLPQIEASQMSNLTVKPGQKVVFNCKVDLSCMVSTIRWYHEMENGTEVLIKTPSSPGLPYVHSIKRVSQNDQGMYTCVARNVVGKAYAAAYLQVNAAPAVKKQHSLQLLLVLSLGVWILFQNQSYNFQSGLS